MACHFRVASPTMPRMGLPVSFSLGVISWLWRNPAPSQLIGRGRAMEMILRTGGMSMLLGIGIRFGFNYVVEQEQFNGPYV